MVSNYNCWNPTLSLHSKVSDDTTTVLPWQHSARREICAAVSCFVHFSLLLINTTTFDQSVQCQSVH